MWKSEGIVTSESFDSLTSYWLDSRDSAIWDCIFVLPPWLEVWWHDFGSDAELYLGAFRKGGTIVGVAPLQLRGTEASFIGSADLCDYLDFVIVPGKEVDFFNILLDDLQGRGIRRLNLRPLRPNSSCAYLSCRYCKRIGIMMSLVKWKMFLWNWICLLRGRNT